MTFASIKAWLMQPSTVHGLGVAAGTIAGLVAHAITHDATWSAAIGGSAYALVHVAVPDNTGAQSSVEKLVSDTVTAVVQKRIADAIPLLFQDSMAVISSFKTTPAPTNVTVNSPSPSVIVAGGGVTGGPVNS